MDGEVHPLFWGWFHWWIWYFWVNKNFSQQLIFGSWNSEGLMFMGRQLCLYSICWIFVLYMLNIHSISNICSVFRMFVPYFKYLFYISNIYSQFEIFVLYPKNLCYISNICCVLKWLYSLILFPTSISILCFKYLFCIPNIRSNSKIFILSNSFYPN